MIEQQTQEMDTLLAEIRSGWGAVSVLPTDVKGLREANDKLAKDLAEVRRILASRGSPAPVRPQGRVSTDCARQLAAQFVLHCERTGNLEALNSSPAERDRVLGVARDLLGISQRAALTTADVPLPTHYTGEIRDLISEFGVVRRQMSPYPIGRGTARPARVGVRPSFGSIAMSTVFPEKNPTIEFASLESHKIGGLVRIPREIDEQSIVPIGQFLAHYGAIEFARAEDTFGFLADGTPGYEDVKGIVQIARDLDKAISLAATKTKPSDVTLDDLRNLRLKVANAALSGRVSAYYLDTSWEARLPTFRTPEDPHVYQRLPDGSAVLDGYPIVWTDVLEPYGTAAAPDKPIAVFGALRYWWFGEHGTPRMDTSSHVFFANDQFAVKFIEEVDFDYIAPDATAALLTADA